jgi:hypothetical protein
MFRAASEVSVAFFVRSDEAGFFRLRLRLRGISIRLSILDSDVFYSSLDRLYLEERLSCDILKHESRRFLIRPLPG